MHRTSIIFSEVAGHGPRMLLKIIDFLLTCFLNTESAEPLLIVTDAQSYTTC